MLQQPLPMAAVKQVKFPLLADCRTGYISLRTTRTLITAPAHQP